MSRFKVTLFCPIPRVGFGSGDEHLENEIPSMREYAASAEGELLVFPEGFLDEKHLKEAEKIAADTGKWIVTGVTNSIENLDQTVQVISPDKGVIYCHTKTSLTQGDWEYGSKQGRTIGSVDTPFCRIGTVLCYEIHFPEVPRIAAIEGAQLLINTVGTGMWHELQLSEWTAIARARAIENRCFMIGTTHFCDPIPMMYAYDPHGREIAFSRDRLGSMTVEIDTDKIDDRDFERDRNPLVYEKLIEKRNEYHG